MRRASMPVWLMSMLLSGIGALAYADDAFKGVGDPTRPPHGIFARTAGAAAPADAASAASVPDEGEAKPKPVSLSLQSIRYELYTGRAVAMINDELVSVGDKVEGMQVISITRQTAVLKGPAGVRTLSLLVDEDEKPLKLVSVSEKGEAAKRGRKEIK